MDQPVSWNVMSGFWEAVESEQLKKVDAFLNFGP